MLLPHNDSFQQILKKPFLALCLIYFFYRQARNKWGGGPPLEFINIQPPKVGPPLEFINLKTQKGGPPLEFINLQPQNEGPPLESINHQPKNRGPPLGTISMDLAVPIRGVD